jgi:hypothetical protein
LADARRHCFSHADLRQILPALKQTSWSNRQESQIVAADPYAQYSTMHSGETLIKLRSAGTPTEPQERGEPLIGGTRSR